MKECERIWIVAPITRAVDEKTAKHLLGDAFRRQMKFDGATSSVTYICSKTDDISVTEAQESLDLDIEQLSTREQILKNEVESMKNGIGELKGEKFALESTVSSIDTEMKTWGGLMKQIRRGKEVYPPAEPRKKRKATGAQSRKTKRRQEQPSSDSEDSTFGSGNDELSVEEEEEEEVVEAKSPLTEEAVDEKLKSLEKEKEDAKNRIREITATGVALERERKKSANDLRGVTSQITWNCIRGRNEYVRTAIKEDFVAGIREYVLLSQME
jgi:chromosome segregation ATPase